MTPIQFFNHGNKDNCLIIDFNFPDKSRWKINRQFSFLELSDFHVDLGNGMGEAELVKNVLIGDKLYLYFYEPIFQMDFSNVSTDQFFLGCYLINPTPQENQTLIDMFSAFGNRPHSEDRKASATFFNHKYPSEIELQISFVYSEDSVSKLIKNRTIKYNI